MKKLILFVIIFFTNFTAQSQKLSLNELFTLCNKPNWDEVNEYILKKGWEYHESSKGDDTHYNTITWSYEKEYYGEKAKGWFYLYTYNSLPNKISYTFFNKVSYTTIKNGITAAGMKLVDNSIEDNEIYTKFEGSSFIVTVSTAKREKEKGYYKDNSITAYSVDVIKKAGVYDTDNGLKKTYDDFGNLESEFTLKNGLLHGPANAYYSNGKIKVKSNFLNGKRQGNSKEYDESGDLTAEYNYLNGEPNGPYKKYENNKVKEIGGLINGKENGLIKVYDEEGRIDEEYNMKLGFYDGPYTGYIYEGKNVFKIKGFYNNDERNGLWQTIKIKKDGTEIIESHIYLNNEKNGVFKEVRNDSIIFGNYKNGTLNGSYKVYRSVSALLLGGLHGDTTNCPLVTIGNYNEGQKHGFWKYYSWTKVLIKEGRFYNDLETGEWKYYFENYVDEKSKPLPYSGELFLLVNYENGKKSGKETRYAFLKRKEVPCYKAGKSNNSALDTCYEMEYQKILQTSFFKNGELNGPFEQKDSNGLIIFNGNFIYGKKDGIWLESYINEDVEGDKYYTFLKGNYVNGLETGIWEEFVENEIIQAKYTYFNGKLNGKTTIYNNSKKPIEERYFANGKLKSLSIYDSLDFSIIRSYEILYETKYGNKYEIYCKKTEFNSDGKVSQNYMLSTNKSESFYNNYFEFIFNSCLEENSDISRGYPDGEFKLYDKDDKILVEGTFYKNIKTGKWKTYYYDISTYTEEDFRDNVGGLKFYFEINSNKPYSGRFIHKHANGKTKFDYRISKGLQDGKSKYFDENGKLIKTEKYKKGVMEN
jgi:antitoxin component YwqK of YwqJK toxin-antitoxin module